MQLEKRLNKPGEIQNDKLLSKNLIFFIQACENLSEFNGFIQECLSKISLKEEKFVKRFFKT